MVIIEREPDLRAGPARDLGFSLVEQRLQLRVKRVATPLFAREFPELGELAEILDIRDGGADELESTRHVVGHAATSCNRRAGAGVATTGTLGVAGPLGQHSNFPRMTNAMAQPDEPGRTTPDTSASLGHRAPDGSFRNPWPDSEPRGWRDLLRWSRQRRRRPPAPTPRRGAFPVAAPAVSYPRARADDFTATWIGHSTVLLQLGGINVLTDPMFSARAFPVQWMGPRRIMDPALPIDALPPLDAVLLSHSHYDHLDKPAVKRIARAHPRTTWIVPHGLAAYVRGWGARDVIELDWWHETVVGALRVTATPARHFSARRLGDRNRSLWCGFALEVGGKRAYFAGDTAYHSEFGVVGARCGPFDFVMIPIGAYDPRWFMHVVHVDPEEAVQVYQDLVAAHTGTPLPLMLGVHWGTFRLTDEPMDEPPRRTIARWRALGLDEDRLWIARFGETRAIPG